MALRPVRVCNFHLPSTLVCINILRGLFGALEIFAFGANVLLAAPTPTPRLCKLVQFGNEQ